MRSPLLLIGALLFGACNLPPKDPFAAAESALRRNDLLEALQAYDAVPVKHERYPAARAAAGDVEQRMLRCHELILEALMLRSEWRDAEALETLNRAAEHWPGQPSLRLWIAATEKRLRLFGDREGVAATTPEAVPSAPLIEITSGSSGRGRTAEVFLGSAESTGVDPVEVPSSGPLPMVPMQSANAKEPASQGPAGPSNGVAGTSNKVRPIGRASGSPTVVPPGTAPVGETSGPSGGDQGQPDKRSTRGSTGNAVSIVRVGTSPLDDLATGRTHPAHEAQASVSPDRPAAKPRRVPAANDPVTLGLVSVAASLDRGELTVAVRDLIELARRFPDDVRVNQRLSRLLHQRALMHYGGGSVAAAVADWRRVIKLDPGNDEVRRMLNRAIEESQPKQRRGQ